MKVLMNPFLKVRFSILRALQTPPNRQKPYPYIPPFSLLLWYREAIHSFRGKISKINADNSKKIANLFVILSVEIQKGISEALFRFVIYSQELWGLRCEQSPDTYFCECDTPIFYKVENTGGQ